MICLLGFDGQVASVCSFVFMLFPCSSQGKAQQSVVFCYLILELYIALDIFFDNILLLILRNVQLHLMMFWYLPLYYLSREEIK
jgi:hypothetical protein